MYPRSLTISTVGVTVAFLLSIFVNGLQAVEYKNCGGEKTVGKFSSVKVEPCEIRHDRCAMKRGTLGQISISFTTAEKMPELKVVTTGLVKENEVPLDLTSEDACVDSNIQCPLDESTSYHYTTTFPVRGAFPQAPIDIKWQLISGDGRDVICVMIPAIIL